VFNDKDIENIGWYATAFDINYRVISAYIESECEGVILYYDNGMAFHGFVLIEDEKEVFVKLLNYIKIYIEDMIQEQKITEFDDDQLEAAEFFDIEV
jgi:hypothetical protein